MQEVEYLVVLSNRCISGSRAASSVTTAGNVTTRVRVGRSGGEARKNLKIWPDRLVEVFEASLKAGSLTRASALNYLSWAERSRHLEPIGAFRNGGLTFDARGHRLAVVAVT